MPIFNDSENKVFLVPEGDYKFTVIECDCKISAGAKSRGADLFALILEIESKLNSKPVTSLCWENLIDHPTCAWKMDCFLKCCGIKLTKGEGFDFREDVAKDTTRRFVNPLGLRGWCHLIVEEGTDKKKRNKVAVFYTDKEKLPAVEIKVEETPEDETPF